MRKPPDPWFGRAKRRRQRKIVKSKKIFVWDGTEAEYQLDYWNSIRHRFLHLSGFQREFQRTCDLVPGFVELLCSDSYSVAIQTPKFTHNDFGFLNVHEEFRHNLDPLPDPTKVTYENIRDCFHMQSLYSSEHDNTPILFDTGATVGVSPFKSDFITYNSNVAGVSLKGITEHAVVLGFGNVSWTIRDDLGRPHRIITNAYHIPKADIRLLSPQVFLRQPENMSKGGSFTIKDDGSALFVFPNKAGRLSFHICDHARLPIAYIIDKKKHGLGRGLHVGLNVLDDANINLSDAQKELLRWHFKLGHFNLPWIQRLTQKRHDATDPIIRTSVRNVNNCPKPLCAACQYAKAHRLPVAAVHNEKKKEKEGILRREYKTPELCISSDQFVSKAPGRLESTYGKEKESLKYTGGTVFVDHATSYMFVQNQISLGVTETLKAKHNFEREATNHGVNITAYRTDNGVYKSREFLRDIALKNQFIDFSGVGAHHQNGVAERAIRTISESARAMMIHAAIHWPEGMAMDLWPFAVDYAVYLWNRMPTPDTGIAPIELYFGHKQDSTHVLSSMHVWGCPCYVLDPQIQDGRKLPKWKPKSRRGQFLGRSKRHASTIGLIRNLNTGSISSQFHVVYDDWFTTVGQNDNDPINPDDWMDLLTFQRERIINDDDVAPPPLAEEWLDDEDLELRRRMIQNQQFRRNQIPMLPRQEIPDNVQEQQVPDALENDESDDKEQVVVHRPQQRPRRPNPRYFGPDFVNCTQAFETDFGQLSNDDAFLAGLGILDGNESGNQAMVHHVINTIKTDSDGLIDMPHPLAFAAKANADDSPNFHQALNGPDAEGFYKAMVEEMESLESLDPWEEVHISSIQGKNILDSTWVFKRKRFPDGSIRKLKARWCVRGDQQIEGIDFFDTYAPVVSWSTVRLLLILTVILGLATKQVDYTQAFIQADLEEEVYVRMPKLFEKPGYVYKLKKSVYGLKQAPLKFFLTLKKGLEARGFKSSPHDPCLFISKDVICLCYVDDCLFFSKEATLIERVIDDLQRPNPTKFILKVESDVAGFLGIFIKKNDDGTLELLQTGLIDRILTITGLTDSHDKHTPSETKPLGKDPDGPLCIEKWSYASVVGMMMYLASNSRPDIAFAVHQCARFTHAPKRCHEQAVKRIARYLKTTKDRGMMFQPTKDLTLDLFADADFAGLWNAEDANDPTCVRSRTGYMLTLGGTPLLWASKLQTEIALSTCEAEYISLSTAMRVLIPIRRVVEEVAGSIGLKRKDVTTISTVWEDNNAAIILANAEYPSMTPRSKHIAVKYHWFRSHLKEGSVEIKRIDTSIQKADIFTKGLARKEFEFKRKLIMGW